VTPPENDPRIACLEKLVKFVSSCDSGDACEQTDRQTDTNAHYKLWSDIGGGVIMSEVLHACIPLIHLADDALCKAAVIEDLRRYINPFVVDSTTTAANCKAK